MSRRPSGKVVSQREWIFLACGIVGFTSAVLPHSATAQTTKESRAAPRKPLSQSLSGTAKADFDAAKLLANDGDFSGALIKFQNAYELSKDTRLLWNVAFCHKNLRHYAKVLATLRRYIAEGDTVISSNDRKEAQELIQLIEPFTTKATIRVNEPGSAIFVDDEPVGNSPLEAPVILDIGERRIRVSKDGFRSFEKAVPVGGSTDISVDVLLEKELHEGKLVVNAPANASIFLDNKAIATHKLEQTVLSGGHQIRVTAPGMHPFQTEIVIQDKETRSLDVTLEALAAAEKPKMSVAVGCADAEPKAPEDGLIVYLDGPDVLSPSQVKRKWSEVEKRNVVQQVEYAVAPGTHRVRVSITDCHPMDIEVVVDPKLGAQVKGALESDKFILFKGAAGSPGWLRLGLGLWLAGGTVERNLPERYTGKVSDVVGLGLDVGLVSRWFGMHVNGALGKGSFQRETFNTHYALPNPAPVTWRQLALRLGPRLPFNAVALGLGVSLGVQELDLDRVRTGKKAGFGGLYTQVDIQPLCDWGLFLLTHVQKPFSDDLIQASIQVGVFSQPNADCRRERATEKGLSTK